MRRTLANIIAATVLCIGIREALLGWLQLCGVEASRHTLYPATGSFYNPGPYCGFLAMLLPLGVWYVSAKGVPRLMTMLSWIYIIPAAGIMPSLMGRTGWVAAAAGVVYVLVSTGRIPRPGRKGWLAAACAVPFVCAAVWWLKPGSALGRVHLWHMACRALPQNPFSGSGWDNVAGALGDAQEKYFAFPGRGEAFHHVAGSPEYAFNEYLQTGIAFGWGWMVVFAALLVFAIYCGHKGREYGFSGGALSFGIVCLASYPLQFPLFAGVAAAIVAAALLSGVRFPVARYTAAVCVAVVAFTGIHSLNGRLRLKEEWNRVRIMCQYRLSGHSVRVLDSLGGKFAALPDYCFDYGKALRKSGMHGHSNEILRKGLSVSSDPMFLNLMGRNSEDMGDRVTASDYYTRAYDRLPSRLYPLYLKMKLAHKMCSDSAYVSVAWPASTLLFTETYRLAMRMCPKVASPAIREMMREIEAMASSLRSLADAECVERRDRDRYRSNENYRMTYEDYLYRNRGVAPGRSHVVQP